VTQRPAPRPRQNVFIIPFGLVGRIVGVIVVLALVAVLIASGTLSRAASGTVVADRATVAAHQAAAERDLERGYETATDQVRKARALKLAIGAAQADAIASKALGDLATLRHSALFSLSQILGATSDAAEAYAKSTEQALDAKRGQAQPSTAPVLLAPRLYAIVTRFDQLATQISDQAVADLTASPGSSPAPSPRPTPTPTPTR
jgi:hypothetical protein